jgi:hypothetical protein
VQSPLAVTQVTPKHQTPSEAASATTAAAGIAEMPDAKKIAKLNSKFPVEFPVIDGKVTFASATTTKQLEYRLLVPAAADGVKAWYGQKLISRAFNLDSAQDVTGGTAYVYSRGSTEYDVRVLVASPQTSIVEAVLKSRSVMH